MKISNNISGSSFCWQIRILRVIAALFLIFGLIRRQSLADMVIFSGISFIASIIFSKRRANFMLEVYDCGDFLKLKLDEDEALINFFDIAKFEIRDGKDGLDWIIVHLVFDSKFGRLIEFYPNMVEIPMERLDVWIEKLSERISASKIANGR